MAAKTAVLLGLRVLLLFCCWIPSIRAHAYLAQPVSRAYYENLHQRFW
jgi:hypothetical protein